MFPHPCGEEFERLAAAGIDPKLVVPDEYVVIRGGTKPIPPPGEAYSCVAGPNLEAAACAVPYNKIRATFAGAIRAALGTVEWLPDFTPHGTSNKQHVHVTETGATAFGEPQSNPVAKAGRIDGGK